MSGTNTDSKLREQLNRFVGPMPAGGRWTKIQAEAARRHRRDRVMKAVAVPVTLLLITALGYWALDALRGEPMVVIDDSSPGEVAGTGTTEQTASVSEKEEILQTVRELIGFVRAGEIEPSWDPPAQSDFASDPLSVLRELEAAFDGPQMSVILDVDADQEDRRRVSRTIESFSTVERVAAVSSGEAPEGNSEGNPPGVNGYGAADPKNQELSFEVWLTEDGEVNEFLVVLGQDPAVSEVNYRGLLPPADAKTLLIDMLDGATAKTPEAEEWLAKRRPSPTASKRVSPLDAMPLTEAAQDPERIAQAEAALAKLVSELESRGVTVLDSEVDRAADPVWVTIKVPQSKLSPESMSAIHELERQPAVLRGAGIVLDYVTVIGVDGDRETLYSEGEVRTPSLPSTPRMDEAEAKHAFDALVDKAAKAGGFSVTSVNWENQSDGRTIDVRMTGSRDSTEVGTVLDAIYFGVFSLNKDEGAGISLVFTTLRTENGKLLANHLADFDLEMQRAWIDPSVRESDRPEFMK